MNDLRALWNDFVRGKPKYLEKNVFQFLFVHYKSHIGVLGLKRGLLVEMLDYTLRYGDV